jgi:transcriptional regulator with XRE-family HTH domain
MNDEQSDDLAAVRARLAMAVTELKVRRGLTQSHLAARAGISVALVERVEHASPGDIGLDTLAALADALGVDVSALMKAKTQRQLIR